VPYPDKVLADDEEVVRHLHPHWLTIFWPVVWFLLIVGAASFGAAVIPAGQQQGVWRLVVAGLAVLLVLVLVVGPLLRWRTTHYVITTHRLLFREGVLARRGRDIGLSRITDVSYSQTLWERIINSGTVTIESAGRQRGHGAAPHPRQRRRPTAAQPHDRGGRRPAGPGVGRLHPR
jgi:uncharacterized membrane protein YdbT with pleckstrin-like domain